MASGGARSTAWKKGESPVKKKGTKHKSTLAKEAFGVSNWKDLQAFVDGPGVQKLTMKMQRLKPKDYAIVFLSLCEFIKPKLQRTTIAGDSDNPIKSEMKVTIVHSPVPISESEESVL